MKNFIVPTILGLFLIGYPLHIENPVLRAAEGGVPLAEAAGSASALKTYTVWVTAYSSTPEETDDTPFITASNSMVRDGIIALNFLPFGTKVRIPKLFGNRVFTVEDRMHYRKSGFADIWMPSKEAAIAFGISRAEIVVVN
jgi:3D (Asp-Asp-Asp) domain-containing protein